MTSGHEVELTVSSAKDLKNVNWRHGRTKPYAVVWIDPKNKLSTRVDEEGDTNPHWDHTLVIPFDSPIDDSTLHIDVVHADAAEDTKPLIGSARLPLRDLVDDVGIGERATRKLELKRPSGRPQGKIEVDVVVRQPRYRAPDPYYAPPYGVPPPPPVTSRDYYAAPPPPYAGGPYGAPPPPGYPYNAPPYGQPPAAYGQPYPYGAPPYGQAGGYGYGQGAGAVYGQSEEKKKGKLGMGTGLAVGAVAGVLGGLALAEGVDCVEDKIADDVAERVEEDEGFYDDDGDF